MSLTTSIASSEGTRTIAFSISSSKRGQSSSRSFPLKSAGIPSSDHGAQFRSYPPMIRPPDSGRKYTSNDGSRIVGMSCGSPLGLSTRYSCAIGTIGTTTPASAPISRAYIPPAFTTTSVSISPRSVSTASTRPPRVRMPVTRVDVAISAPRRRAPSARANVSWLGSM